MSDLVAVALITSAVNVGLRFMSHYEHRDTSRHLKKTSEDVKDIKKSVNGDLDERIREAVERYSKGSK